MAEAEDELERIRERKRRELLDDGADGAGSADPAPTEDEAPDNAAPDEPVHIEGTDHLEEVVGTYDTVLVDFYADWCGPCQMLEPVVEELARETDAAVAKVDVDAQQALAGAYGVRGVPTLVLFSGGEVVEQLTGARDKATLERLVAEHA